MGLFSKDIKTFDQLFAHGLRDIMHAETRIAEALPELIAQAVQADLKRLLEAHLAETQRHVARLEDIFRLREEEPRSTRCVAIEGLIKESEAVVGEIDNETVMDAAIIASARAVERYEMTRYEALITWASGMGRRDIVRILAASLEDERRADDSLRALAAGGGEPRRKAPARARAGAGRRAAKPVKPRRRASPTRAAGASRSRSKPARRPR